MWIYWNMNLYKICWIEWYINVLSICVCNCSTPCWLWRWVWSQLHSVAQTDYLQSEGQRRLLPTATSLVELCTSSGLIPRPQLWVWLGNEATPGAEAIYVLHQQSTSLLHCYHLPVSITLSWSKFCLWLDHLVNTLITRSCKNFVCRRVWSQLVTFYSFL